MLSDIDTEQRLEMAPLTSEGIIRGDVCMHTHIFTIKHMISREYSVPFTFLFMLQSVARTTAHIHIMSLYAAALLTPIQSFYHQNTHRNPGSWFFPQPTTFASFYSKTSCFVLTLQEFRARVKKKQRVL